MKTFSSTNKPTEKCKRSCVHIHEQKDKTITGMCKGFWRWGGPNAILIKQSQTWFWSLKTCCFKVVSGQISVKFRWESINKGLDRVGMGCISHGWAPLYTMQIEFLKHLSDLLERFLCSSFTRSNNQFDLRDRWVAIILMLLTTVSRKLFSTQNTKTSSFLASYLYHSFHAFM